MYVEQTHFPTAGTILYSLQFCSLLKHPGLKSLLKLISKVVHYPEVTS